MMPYGVPFDEWRQTQLARAAAAGDRISQAMLEHDLYFEDAIAHLAREQRAARLARSR
jgi:hypothetical protein